MNATLLTLSLLLASLNIGCEAVDLESFVSSECADTESCDTEATDSSRSHGSEASLDEPTGTRTQEHEDEPNEDEFQDEASERFEASDEIEDEEEREIAHRETEHETMDVTNIGTLRIQAIGDSHLAFNGDMSTADQLGDVLRERGVDAAVQNNAVGGATLGCGANGIGSRDNCIPPQFESGQWTHVVVSAGGNDFLESQCGVDVNALLSPDLEQGLMVELIERIRDSGALVVIVGYVSPLDPQGEAGSCHPIKTLLTRYRELAAARSGVRFVDTRDVFGPSQRSLYADDIHTSIAGSRRLAEAIADGLMR